MSRLKSLGQTHTNADVLWLGPVTYLHAVTETLTGRRILPLLHGPSYRNDEMKELVKSLKRFYPVIITKTEHSQCDTIIYHGTACKYIHNNKMLLYKRSGLTYWQNSKKVP